MTRETIDNDLHDQIRSLQNALAQTRKELDEHRLQGKWLQAILDNVNLPIYLKNADFRYMMINRQFEMLAQVSTAQLSGKCDFDIFPEPVAALFREQDEAVVNKRGLEIFEETIPLPGGVFTFLTSKFPVLDEDGVPRAVGGVCTDITQLKTVEEALRQSEERFRNVIDLCPIGILQFRLTPEDQLICLRGNAAADRILLTDSSRFVGRTLEESLPFAKDSELSLRLREVVKTGRRWQTPHLEYAANDHPIHVEILAFVTAPDTVAVFFSDLTHKHQLEEEIRKNQKLESIGTLAGGIAHDFNNLLTAILGSVSMAEVCLHDEAKLKERLQDARKATLRATGLTHQLLTFAKGGKPVRATVRVEELVEESATFALSGSSSRFHFDSGKDLLSVNADAGQIGQVIQNVIRNADQAMPEGGVIAIRAANRILDSGNTFSLDAGNYVEIAISDSGVGIPQAHLSRIFDPYFTTKQRGSGLGLASAYSIVKNHNGVITASSKSGEGSTFTILLPASIESTFLKKTVSDHPLPANKKILVMDDNENVLSAAVNMLTHFNYVVETAENGTIAVSRYAQALRTDFPFDAVILDLTVPAEMGGVETLRQLREMDPLVKAVVCSGYANNSVMSDFQKYGFKAVLSKPFDIETLSSTVSKLFE